MSVLLSWLRTAARAFTRSPAHSWSVAATLAVGIAFASATGVIARAIAFAGLPVRDAERVVVMWGVDGAGSFTHLPLAPLDVPPLADAMRGVATVAWGDYDGASAWDFRATDGASAPLRLRGTLAGGNYFELLGARPVLGRTLRQDDDVIGAERVIVLSHSAWRRHFGGDSSIVGRMFDGVQQGTRYTVIGVMPPGLDVPRGVEFWTAFSPTAARNGSLADSPWNVDVFARLEPGATAEQARQVLERYYQTLGANGKTPYRGATATVRTLPDLVTGDVRPVFAALAAAAVLVLLVTGVNVSGLLLLRATSRRRELAVRAAIGAARRRLVRELIVEHAMLATVGGLLGAMLAAALVRAFVRLAPPELPRVGDLVVDWSLLLFVVAVTAVIVLIVGVAPALAASRVAPATVLGGARSGAGGARADVRTRRFLVAAQVAMALVVLIGASLLGRSLLQLTALDLGMSASDELSIVELVPPAPESAAPAAEGSEPSRLVRWRSTLDAITSRLASTPGIVAVAPVTSPPFTSGWKGMIGAVGAPSDDSARRPYLNMELTDEHFLRSTGLALLRGRWLAGSDREDAPKVVVLSEGAARALFPGRDALGERVRLWGDAEGTVIGIVADTRYREFLEPGPAIYFPHRQFAAGVSFLLLRSTGDAASVASAVRSVVASVAPSVLVQERGSMRQLLSTPLARPRVLAAVLASYAIVVVVLAVAGLYTVIAGSVINRRREFGVRAALGATPASLMSLVLGEGMQLTVAGAAVGLLIALGASRALRALLHGVAPGDPTSFGASAMAMMVVCGAAVLVPAWRAGRADPARELRTE